MRSYLHITTFITFILSLTADCGAREHVVYKPIGAKVHLTLKEHWNITTVKWRKDNELIASVDNKVPAIRHPEKYHIHASNNSLFIHNLTVDDSGLYKAQTGQWETEIILYKLIVQEAVSKPVIELKHEQQSNASSVCHILVKCSADGDSVTYDCYYHQCTRTNGTFSKVTITMNYTENGVFECTARNRVSEKLTSLSIKNTCSEKKPESPPSVPYILTVILITLPFILVLGVVIFCFIKWYCNTRKKKQNKGAYQEDTGINTVYSEVRKAPRTDSVAASSDAQNATTTVYDVPSKCVRAPQTESGDCMQKDDTHTVYWKLGQTQ